MTRPLAVSLAIVVAFCVLVSALRAQAAEPFVCVRPGITDGDTVRCGDGTRVRVWGIQAPERHHAAGPAATRALANIIGRSDLTCTAKGKSYNRIVAQCFRSDGQDIARMMVEQGHAVDWPKFSKGYYAR